MGAMGACTNDDAVQSDHYHIAFLILMSAMQGFTCMKGACTNYDAAVLELLLKHGGDVHAQDKTPVSHTC